MLQWINEVRFLNIFIEKWTCHFQKALCIESFNSCMIAETCLTLTRTPILC